MKNFILYILLIFAFSSCSNITNKKGKILIIVSNIEYMGDPEKHFAGNNLLEVAPPYHVFSSHGYNVDFASPSGEKIPFSMEPLGISSYTIKYENFMEKVNQSITPEKIIPANYDAVYIGGGYGPLFDVAVEEKLLSVIASIYENGGILGGCGHGPGAYANVKLSNGNFLVSQKKITGFPNSTEKTKAWANEGTLLPFLVEDQLRKNGAIFLTKNDLEDKHDIVIDQRIISTMFLPSAAIVAKEMILQLEEQ